MIDETELGFMFLDSVLSPDSTLAGYAPGGVSRGFAPPGNAVPYVIMSLQSPGADSQTITGFRLLTNPLYFIRATGPASMTQQIANASTQINVLLGGKDGLRNQSIAGGFIASCIRQSPFQQDTIENGEDWVIFGGLWRLQIE